MAKVKKLDKQLLEQPREVFYCSKCVVSNQRPRITFDENRVCSACQWAWKKHHEIDWKAREKQLIKLLDKHRSKDGSYDVIVPSSGGKDSGYTAHVLKEKYGMHPLTVTFAPFRYTDIGWKNYIKFIDSGFDNLNFFQNGIIQRKLARICFDLRGDHWDAFAFGQKSYALTLAWKFGIPLLFYGENGEVEYGGSTHKADKPYDDPKDWEKIYYKGAGIDKVVEAGIKMGIIKKNELGPKSLMVYRTPPLKELARLGVQFHWMSYYRKWVPQENFYYAQKHTGFETNPDGRSEGTYSKYASLDDRTDGFHYYLAFIKFGIGRATSDAAHEIRDGHITREEGVSLVRRYDGEFPKKYFPEFLEYLGITEEHFWKVIDSYRSPHLWKKEKGEWKLKYQVS